MALQPSKLILHNVKGSNCCARVRIAASLKNIPLEMVEYRFANGGFITKNDPDPIKKDPNATLPILEAHYGNGDPLILTQSLSMLQFLEDSYPGGMRLIPPTTDMAARCKVRDLALLVACDLQPLQNIRVLSHLKHITADPKILARHDGMSRIMGDYIVQRAIRKEWIRRVSKRIIRVYEELAKKSAGRFSVGDDVSIADICLAALVQPFSQHGGSFDFGKDYETIARILKNCEAIDAFRSEGVVHHLRKQRTSQSNPAATDTSQPGSEPRSTNGSENEVAESTSENDYTTTHIPPASIS